MKRILLHLIYIIAAPALLLLTGCDEVDETDRYVYVKPAAVGRNILIEDYTGQGCVNCPTGTNQLHALQEQYGADTVIVVGFHSGPQAKSKRSHIPYSLWTQDGEDYYTHWKVENQPSIYIDRVTLNETTTAWPTLVRDELQKPASLKLTAKATAYSAPDSLCTFEVYAQGTDGTTTGHLQLWITEDGITDFQYMPDGSVNREYVHNHVYRMAVNGLWGDDFSIKEGEEKTLPYTCKLKGGWKPENMHMVAFVYNDSGVQQVTTCTVIPAEEPTAEEE